MQLDVAVGFGRLQGNNSLQVYDTDYRPSPASRSYISIAQREV